MDSVDSYEELELEVVCRYRNCSYASQNGMHERKEKQGAVMVIGGGIAGIQASLDLADLGFEVHLVERASAIGGMMAQLDKTFPTNDCAM